MLTQSEVANILLKKMRPEDFGRLTTGAAVVALRKGQELSGGGHPITHCWYPLSGLISVIALDEDDAQAEVGICGIDGFADVGAVLGDNAFSMRHLVQISGEAMRVDIATIRHLMSSSPDFAALMSRYVRAFSIQIASSALAYANYPIPRRLARWLLMCVDRVGTNEVSITHESLSIMLGVRRAGVTVALGSFEAAGLVENRRGGMKILDHDGLRAVAGSGYGHSEAEYHRLVGQEIRA